MAGEAVVRVGRSVDQPVGQSGGAGTQIARGKIDVWEVIIEGPKATRISVPRARARWKSHLHLNWAMSNPGRVVSEAVEAPG